MHLKMFHRYEMVITINPIFNGMIASQQYRKTYNKINDVCLNKKKNGSRRKLKSYKGRKERIQEIGMSWCPRDPNYEKVPERVLSVYEAYKYDL